MKKPATNKTLICIPTYNEAENVESIFNQISELRLDADILFVDDNSPDGTGAIIERRRRYNPHIHVIHRLGKQGIGSAHLDGIHWAYENNYQILITMDCDLTHSPTYLPRFIKNSFDYDIVVGSRYKQKDSLKDWIFFRKALTHTGHLLTKSILKMPYDATGAFRLYRIDKIPIGIFDLIYSKGYSFLFESLYIFHINGYLIKEVPIRLPTRTYGDSKMKIRDVANSLLHLAQVYLRMLINKESLIYSKPFIIKKALDSSETERK